MTREWEFTCRLRILAKTEQEAIETIKDYFKEFGDIDDNSITEGVLEAEVDLNPIA